MGNSFSETVTWKTENEIKVDPRLWVLWLELAQRVLWY